VSFAISLADSSPAMRGLASAVSHTCTSGVHVYPQWRAYDDSLTTVSCATDPRTGQPLPCCHVTIAQLMASLTCMRGDHMGFTLDCIRSSFMRLRMKDAQVPMTQYANRNHMESPPFRVGDRVYVRTDHIRMNRTTRKLAEKKIDPFPIVSQPSAMSFTLRLPSTIRIHPVFYVAQLEPENPNIFEDRDQPPRLPIVDGIPEYLIKRTIDPRYNCARCKCQLLYHIKWVGYPISNNPSDWILANPSDDEAGKISRMLIISSILQSPAPNIWPRNGSNIRLPRLQTSGRYQHYNTTTHSTHYHPPSSTPSPDHVRSALN